MTHALTHAANWYLEKVTRKGSTLFAYLLDTREADSCNTQRYLMMFCYVASFQVTREQCVGLECYDCDGHILREMPKSSYLMMVDECGTLGYKHFRLQAANYTVDVITDEAPSVQLVSE